MQVCMFGWFQESDNLWWDAFATEFFEDEATLTLSFCLEDGPKRYSKSTASLGEGVGRDHTDCLEDGPKRYSKSADSGQQ